MDDSDILQHLLEIEGQASALVNDAQAEAGRRFKIAEDQNRSWHDKQHHALVKELEEDYQREAASVRAEYEHSLEEYSHGLDSMSPDRKAFDTLAFSLFFGRH
ncbi:MAG: hypothetical protein LBO65_08885 [Spirochaetaceae bacterium]|jgi:vacuolar-type H+-ATPase subunit H|nr:hypothetical protein [Spirochaetaceae bacterium]